MRRAIIFYGILLTAMAMLWYFFYPTSTPSSPWGNTNSGLRGDMQEKYVMITNEAGADRWKNVFKGFEDAGETLNVSVDYVGASDYDPTQQATIIEQVIAKKPKGIALAGINAQEVLDAITKATDLSIPVVTIDTPLSSSKVLSHIGTDNYQAGVEAARRMIEDTLGTGDLAIVMNNSRPSEQLRMQGFLDTIKTESPTQKIVSIVNSNGDRVAARNQAIQIMDDHPTLTGIFATDTTNGIGVAEAAVYFNKKTIKIITFDADIRTLDYISKGIITASVQQGNWNMGYWSLQYLFQLKHHLLNESEYIERSIPLLPEKVYTDISFITSRNVNNFYVK